MYYVIVSIYPNLILLLFQVNINECVRTLNLLGR